MLDKEQKTTMKDWNRKSLDTLFCVDTGDSRDCRYKIIYINEINNEVDGLVVRNEETGEICKVDEFGVLHTFGGKSLPVKHFWRMAQ